MSSIRNAGAQTLVLDMAKTIAANEAYLSEIDGRIGDGDHGTNMAKGFNRAAGRVAANDSSLTDAFSTLSDILLSDIGGSMGPLYGTMFEEMAEAAQGLHNIDAAAFGAMLRAGRDGVRDVGGAKPGDKTMVDALDPAVTAYEDALAAGLDFAAALDRMTAAAAQGRNQTRDMVAAKGRARRVGERARGALDAGAVSCCLLLTALADGIKGALSQ